MDLLVTTTWLSENLAREDVKVLDGTWVMPGETASLPSGFIPGAQFFDIDKIAAPHPSLKHMLPNAEMFSRAVSAMGLKSTDHVIIYDRHGVRTAPRLWWTFRMFGHAKVSILDGGLPAWINSGHAVDAAPLTPNRATNYQPQNALSGVVSQDEILAHLGDLNIVDARAAGRFYGTTPEPRAGLKSGHIPGSLSLPISNLWTEEGHFKPLTEIAALVGEAGVDLTQPVITSCGSGITAAGIAFNLYRLGAKDVSVYDGSWAEWGASDAPIEVD